VAVKVMASGRINKEMEKSFKQEVRDNLPLSGHTKKSAVLLLAAC
jgi:hypothetical protein